MKKWMKYLLLLAIVAITGYKSIYIKKLSALKAAPDNSFNAASFTDKLWNERMPARIDSAVSLQTLITAIGQSPVQAFSRYSNALGIGNYRYSLVTMEGQVEDKEDDQFVLAVRHADTLLRVVIETEFVYGNAVRDASGLVDIRDFSNTADLNAVSEQLNKKIKTGVIAPQLPLIKNGDTLSVTGAIELNSTHIRFDHLHLIPVRIQSRS